MQEDVVSTCETLKPRIEAICQTQHCVDDHAPEQPLPTSFSAVPGWDKGRGREVLQFLDFSWCSSLWFSLWQ